MLPNMQTIVAFFAQPVKLKRATQIITDYAVDHNYNEDTINAVVQVAKPSQLIVDVIDYNLQYIMVHSQSEFAINDVIHWDNRDFKVVARSDWHDYQYYRGVCEEIA